MATGSERALQRTVRAISRLTLRRGTEAVIDASSLRRLLLVATADSDESVRAATPLARALREGLPHIRIDWLIASRREGLVQGLYLADRLIPFDRRRFRRNPAALGLLLRELRANEYDAVIDAARHDTFSLTSALLVRWTGAKVRIGPARADAAHFYSHPIACDAAGEVEAKLMLLGPLGLRERGTDVEIALTSGG